MTTKQSGLGMNFFVDGYNLSGDINSLGTISMRLANTDQVTGIDKFAIERKALAKDGEIAWIAYLDADAGAAHPKLSALPTADIVASAFVGAATLGNPVASLVGKQIGYDGNRTDDGSLRFSVDALANGYGLEWGRSLTTGVRSDSAATNGSSIDTTASASFGAQAYLHVFSFTGTDVTITIQDSADDISFADVTGLSFTEVTAAPTSERIATGLTATIRRYIRVVTTTTGGFSALTFAVNVVKNKTAITF